MPIEIRCRQCHQPFTPTPDALRKGPPYWWYCDRCRAAEAQEPAGKLPISAHLERPYD
jgi:hypothetical protein